MMYIQSYIVRMVALALCLGTAGIVYAQSVEIREDRSVPQRLKVNSVEIESEPVRKMPPRPVSDRPNSVQERNQKLQENKEKMLEAAQEKRDAMMERKKEQMSSTTNQMKNRAGEMFERRHTQMEQQRSKVEERRATVDDRINTRLQERRAEIEQRWEERKVRLTDARKERIRTHIQKMVEHVKAVIARLASLADKVEVRITKLADEGIDVSVARGLLTTARTKIADAEAAFDRAKAVLEAGVNAENPGKAFEEARVIFAEVKTALREAHKALVDAIVSVKGRSTGSDSSDSSL